MKKGIQKGAEKGKSGNKEIKMRSKLDTNGKVKVGHKKEKMSKTRVKPRGEQSHCVNIPLHNIANEMHLK